MNVPFVDLKAQYKSLKSEIDTAIQSVIDNTAFIGGKSVKAFEQAYAKKFGVKHCVSCANGTDAIYIALKALGIGPGDEVITVANTWISTSETITQAGAKPVFVDIDEYFHIDPQKIEEKITKKTKAVIPVHLYGQAAAIDAILRICESHGLPMIEDCAQSHFSTFDGRKTGTFGLAGTFSFYPGKNLGAYGDAGALITNDDAFARKARLFANHGSLQKHIHEIEGINSRLDAIQAEVLAIKLNHIDEWNKARHAHGLKYNALLAAVPRLKYPKLRENAFHIFHIYSIRVPKRDELADYLKSEGISTGIHYPTALPFMPAYSYMGHKPSDFPVAYQGQNEILSLPMYPELTDEMIEYVARAIKDFFAKYLTPPSIPSGYPGETSEPIIPSPTASPRESSTTPAFKNAYNETRNPIGFSPRSLAGIRIKKV
ncbi:MAG: DegT/DnrJ/EryC1/StrS family aminotransferase [Candidatus Aminicenantales bacterium]